MNIRSIILILTATAIAIATLPSKATELPPVPASAVKIPPLTAANVPPDAVRAACLRTAQQQETNVTKVWVTSVDVANPIDEHTAGCLVTATVYQIDGYPNHGSGFSMVQSQEQVRYSGSVDLRTAQVRLTKVDDASAEDVALKTLEGMFIVMKKRHVAADRITYTATVADKTCDIELVTNTALTPTRWVTKSVNCSR